MKNFCRDQHDEVSFDVSYCPVCQVIDTAGVGYTRLEERIEDMQQEIDNLRENAARRNELC